MINRTTFPILVTAILLIFGIVLLGCGNQDEQTPVAQAPPIQIPAYTLVGPDTPTAAPTTTPIPTPTPVTDENVRATTVSPKDISTFGEFLEGFSISEVSCVQDALGEELFNEVLEDRVDTVFPALSEESLDAADACLFGVEVDEEVDPNRPTPLEIGSIVLMESTTLREVTGQLPADVVECLRSALGDEVYTDTLDTPLDATDLTSSISLSCFSSSEEEAAWGAVLLFSSPWAEDWGLSRETRRCIQPVAATNGFVLGTFIGVHTESPTPEEYISGTLGFLLCLNAEEATALAANPEGSTSFPSPSELRCMDGELESLEPLELLYIWREPDMEATRAVAAAARQCGVEHGPWDLSAETRMCVRPIWDATNGLSVSELPPSPEEIVLGALESLLCHTDEEAEDVILSSSIEGGTATERTALHERPARRLGRTCHVDAWTRN